jgi:hypothetical protein
VPRSKHCLGHKNKVTVRQVLLRIARFYPDSVISPPSITNKYFVHLTPGAWGIFGRSRDRFPVVSPDFSVTYLLPTVPWPWGRLILWWKWVPGTFLGVKAAGAWGWQPHYLRVPNVKKSGSLNLLEPSGPHRACYGNPLPFTSNTDAI